MKIDFHAHILPRMDHGCRNLEMAMRQLELAMEYNVDVIVASSHFYPHSETVEQFIERRRKAWEDLQPICEGKMQRVLLGAEVLVCSGMEKMEDLHKLCVEGTNVLLLEMPFADRWDEELIATVGRIVDMCGLRVVLAHAERYRSAEVEKILKKGVSVQINADSLLKYKRCIRYIRARKLIKKKCVVALGSDIHGLQNNYAIFAKILRRNSCEMTQIQGKTQELLRGVLE